MNHPSALDHETRRLRRTLRRTARERRRALSARAQRAAAGALAAQLLASDALRGARNVAAYLPRDGEIDPLVLLERLADRGVRPWLPIVEPIASRGPALRFGRLADPAQLRRNRWGIPEPARRGSRAPWTLDAVLMPLVAFDGEGNRLGMGGGFYDAAFDLRRPRPARPRLIGLAHRCQQVDALPAAAHDVPLDLIATDEALIRASSPTPTGD